MRLGLLSLGLVSSACVAFGYDFDEYQAAEATGNGGSAGAGSHPRSTEVGRAEGGERSSKLPVATGAGGAAEPGRRGAAGEAGEECGGAAGVTSMEAGAAGSGSVTTQCEPNLAACFDAGAQCGPVDDGCGQPVDCGPCFWWFETCKGNHCIILDSESE